MMPTDPKEVPIAMPTPAGHRFGILSEPATPSPVGVLVLPAHGNAFGGRTRFVHRLSRRLATSGLRTLRIDYEGTGESGGGVATLNAGDPAVDDAEAGARAVIARGHKRIVVVGYCYGARVAMAVFERLPEILAVVLISPPVLPKGGNEVKRTVASLVRGAFEPARWGSLRHRAGRQRYRSLVRRTFRNKVPWSASRREAMGEARRPKIDPLFLRDLTGLTERGTPTLMVYGESDKLLGDIGRAADARVDDLLAASSIEFHRIPGAIHGLRDEVAEDTVIEIVTTWVGAIAAGECRATQT